MAKGTKRVERPTRERQRRTAQAAEGGMVGPVEPLEWQHVYGHWRRLCKDRFPLLAEPVRFEEIRPPEPPERYIQMEHMDWWPNGYVETGRALMRDNGYTGYDTPKGWEHTSALLWHAKGNTEATAAVWIAAALLDKERARPIYWSPEHIRQQDAVTSPAIELLGRHKLALWHPRVRERLPISVAGGFWALPVIPQRPEDFITIAAVEAALSLATHTLIRIPLAARS